MAERMKESYNVPDGYFDALKARLRSIPAKEEAVETVEPTTWMKLRPLVSLAASMAILVVCGTFLLRLSTSVQDREEDYNYAEYAYAITPVTEPYAIYDSALAESVAQSVSGDDIVNYLIDTGISLDQIGYDVEYE